MKRYPGSAKIKDYGPLRCLEEEYLNKCETINHGHTDGQHSGQQYINDSVSYLIGNIQKKHPTQPYIYYFATEKSDLQKLVLRLNFGCRRAKWGYPYMQSSPCNDWFDPNFLN